jgi:mannose-6-phosphate isomerase-like protein (cupin superfamily)
MQATLLKADATREYFFSEGCHILELSNSAADPSVSIARARVEPGVTTRLHCLSQTIERYVLLSGTGSVSIGDNLVAEVGPGDVVLIPPGCPQKISNTGLNDLVFLAICSPRFTLDIYQELE